MLKIKLGKIVNYAYQKGEAVIRKAMAEFFGKTKIYPEMENFQSIQGFFHEWLVFDFKLKSGINIISDYYLKNPDNLSQDILNELKQIIKTQFFDILEIVDVRPGAWLKLYGLSSGKIYKVYDKVGSSNNISKGSLWTRLGKVNNRWYLVGSNPLCLPIISTPRMRKIYLKQNKGKYPSIKKVLSFLLPKENKGIKRIDPSQLTPKDIKNKRKKLEKKFNKLVKANSLKVSFKQITDFVYEENYKNNHADFPKDLAKLGIPQGIIVKKIQFFGEVWNFFPHKKLKGKSPVEMYKKRYKGKY